MDLAFTIQGTSVNIAVGSQVWIDDAELAWVDGEVKNLNAREATILTSHGKTVRTCLLAFPHHHHYHHPWLSNQLIFLRWSQVVADISNIYPKDMEAPPAGVDDMTKLAYLHEPGVLHNLACRFAINEIYVSLFSITI